MLSLGLCLLINFCFAQNEYSDLKKFSAQFEKIDLHQVSVDGNWGTFVKTFDEGQQVGVIYEATKDVAKLTEIPRSKEIILLSKGKALVKFSDSIQLLDLKKQSFNSYLKTSALQVSDNRHYFAIRYDSKPNNVFVYDSDGAPLFLVENCLRLWFRESQIYALTQLNDLYQVEQLNVLHREILYSSKNKILQIQLPSKNNAVLITEEFGFKNQLRYVNKNTHESYILNDSVKAINAQYYVKDHPREETFIISRQYLSEPPSGNVSIWHGEDRNLINHFFPSTKEELLVWEPRAHKFEMVCTDLYREVFSINSVNSFIMYDKSENKDYLHIRAPLKLMLYDRKMRSLNKIGTPDHELITDEKGEYLVFKENDTWKLYDTASKTAISIHEKNLNKAYFSQDAKSIFFTGKEGLWKYDISSRKLLKYIATPGFETDLVDYRRKYLLSDYPFYSRTISNQQEIPLKLFSPLRNTTSIVFIKGSKINYLVSETEDRIDDVRFTNTNKTFTYVRENFNEPPRISQNKSGKEHLVYQSNSHDLQNSLKMQAVKKLNDKSNKIVGTLFYPVNFEPNKKYPMIVEIYKRESHKRNIYLGSSFHDSLGFNIRQFLEEGYFVFRPDIEIGDKGPGLSALDQVHNALDEVVKNKSVDSKRVGLIGHSFGGYETFFIATKSSRFACYVAGSGHSDIVYDYFAFAENFYAPNFARYENGPYEMTQSFGSNKQKYFDNNPIYSADQVQQPILIWTGLQDNHVEWRQSRNMFNALSRNGKKVVALFYGNEPHSLFKKENQEDLTKRIMDWMNNYLKDLKAKGWIDYQ